MRSIEIKPPTPDVGPEQITVTYTMYPMTLHREKADLKKVAMSLAMKLKAPLQEQLEDLVQRQANLIEATTGSAR